jgi:hypothetical protein
MNSREAAAAMRNTANYLDSLEEFDMESVVSFMSTTKKGIFASAAYWGKDKFVAAVKVMGNVVKTYDTGDYPRLRVTARDFPFEANISRDSVCTKKVTYDCQPLFTADEVEAL